MHFWWFNVAESRFGVQVYVITWKQLNAANIIITLNDICEAEDTVKPGHGQETLWTEEVDDTHCVL